MQRNFEKVHRKRRKFRPSETKKERKKKSTVDGSNFSWGTGSLGNKKKKDRKILCNSFLYQRGNSRSGNCNSTENFSFHQSEWKKFEACPPLAGFAQNIYI